MGPKLNPEKPMRTCTIHREGAGVGEGHITWWWLLSQWKMLNAARPPGCVLTKACTAYVHAIVSSARALGSCVRAQISRRCEKLAVGQREGSLRLPTDVPHML